MGRTFRRSGRRNRYLLQRRERLPSIRAVETTFAEINRQTLSPVRQSRSPSALRVNDQKVDYECDDNALIENNDISIHNSNDSDDVHSRDKHEYEPMHCDNNDNVDNDDVTEHEINRMFNDVTESQCNTSDSPETPTCSSWATAIEQQVREAEMEYEKTTFVEESVKTRNESSKTYGKYVSIKEIGRIYYKNYRNSYSIHYKRLQSLLRTFGSLISCF